MEMIEDCDDGNVAAHGKANSVIVLSVGDSAE
jgi:hypothetical protein